jgi:phospholipid transport system substrate-binding protein
MNTALAIRVRPGMRVTRVVTLALVLAASAGLAEAKAKNTATEAIKGANDKLRQLLGQKAAPGSDAEKKLTAEVATELRDLLDIGFLAERALVDHWSTMTEKQRTDVADTLRAVVEQNYLTQLRTNLDYQVAYGAEEAKGSDVLVHTVIKATRKGKPAEVKVDYLVRDEGDRWRVYDVSTDDVSLLDNYRSQFNRIIAKSGVDGLIAKMKSKLDAK